MMSEYDSLVKWAVMAMMYAALTVLAACAEDGYFGTGVQIGSARVGDLPDDPMPIVKPTIPLPSPSSMLGKDVTSIEAELGKPSLLREEMGAQVWQYTDQVCVLLLYLYESDDTVWRVTHAETRRKRGVRSATNCMATT